MAVRGAVLLALVLLLCSSDARKPAPPPPTEATYASVASASANGASQATAASASAAGSMSSASYSSASASYGSSASYSSSGSSYSGSLSGYYTSSGYYSSASGTYSSSSQMSSSAASSASMAASASASYASSSGYYSSSSYASSGSSSYGSSASSYAPSSYSMSYYSSSSFASSPSTSISSTVLSTSASSGYSSDSASASDSSTGYYSSSSSAYSSTSGSYSSTSGYYSSTSSSYSSTSGYSSTSYSTSAYYSSTSTISSSSSSTSATDSSSNAEVSLSSSGGATGTSTPTSGGTGSGSPSPQTSSTPAPGSTTPPPRTTANPWPFSLTSIVVDSAPKFFLRGRPGTITLRAAFTGDASEVNYIEFRAGGTSIGKVSSPSGTSFVVSYNVPTNLAVTLMSATPYLKSNRYSPPVSLNLPIFDAPAWLPALVSCGALACLGSFNNWGAGTNVAFVRSVTADKFPIPLIGFGCATSFSANYGASVSSDGKATLSGGGSASFSIDSNFIPLLSGASVGITVSSDFAFAQGANGFYTTQLSALHAIISGSLSLKTPLSFKTPEVSVASYTLSAQISVPISIGISMDLVFGLNERGRLLGQDIPFSFQSINGGSLSLGASVSGKVALIVTSASVGGAVTLSPSVTWDNQGFKFNGITASATISVTGDIVGYGSVSSKLWSLSTTFFGSQPATRDSPGRIEPRGKASGVTVTPLKNIWAPKIQGQDPLNIRNVYPSSQFPLLRVNDVDLVAFSSFDRSRNAPSDQQVQFTFRVKGGSWSALAFIPSPSSPPKALPVASPVLARIEDTAQVMIIATQATNPSTSSLDDLNVRLVYSTFDTRARTMQPWSQALPTSTGSFSDFGPVMSHNALVVAFKRTSSTGVSTLMASMLQGKSSRSWGAPITVAAKNMDNLVSYAIDADEKGNALLVYTLTNPKIDETCTISLCFFAYGSSSWSCNMLSGALTDARGSVAVVFSKGFYTFAFNRDSTVYSQSISAKGSVLGEPISKELPVYPIGLTAVAVGTSIESAAAVLGFNTLDITGNGFGYALVDADNGKIFYSPYCWINMSSVATGTPLDVSLQYSDDDKELFFASSIRDDAVPNKPSGTLSVRQLPIAADAALSDVKFSPAEFDDKPIEIKVKVTNLGLSPYEAGNNKNGDVTFSLVTGSDPVQSLGSATLRKRALMAGEAEEVSFSWKPTARQAGGIIAVHLTTRDANNTNNAITADPCRLHLGQPHLEGRVSVAGVNVVVNVTAMGYCGATYTVAAFGRPKTGLDGVVHPELLVGSAPLKLTSNMVGVAFRISVTAPENINSVMSVVVQDTASLGEKETRTEWLLADEAYEFSVGGCGETLSSDVGSVTVRLAVANRGSQAAESVSVTAYEVYADGSKKQISKETLPLGAYDKGHVELTLPLTAELNNVQFSVNEGNAYPEIYTTNNDLSCNFYVEGGSEENTGSNGSGGGGKGGSSMGLLVGLGVGIFALVVIAIGVGLFIWRYKGDPTSRSGDNSDRYTLLDKN